MYYSARKYCCKIRDDSDSESEASKSETMPGENIENVVKQEM